jgi:hypothetical protein
MTDDHRLYAELRAARELLARTDETLSYWMCDESPADGFPWLKKMHEEELEAHIERLEHDLAALATESWADYDEADLPTTSLSDHTDGPTFEQATLDSFAPE